MSSLRRYMPDVARAGMLAALYWVTARMGLALGPVNHVATAVWPPTGISLAALLLYGYRLWPGVACGAVAANLSIGVPFVAALGIATGNTLEALLAAYALRRVDFRNSLERVHDVLALAALAALLSTLVSATIGTTSAWLAGIVPSANYASAWLTWWVGDAVGDLVVAPAILVWGTAPRLAENHWRNAELALLIILLAVSYTLILGQFRRPVTWVAFPFAVWAALRHGQAGMTAAVAVIASIAVWITAVGRGPFGDMAIPHGLTLLQAYLCVLSITGLVLAAATRERQAAGDALRGARDNLEHEVHERTAELRGANDALRELSGRLLTLQDEERRRVGRELHEGTAQTLAGVAMNLAQVRQWAQGLNPRAEKALTESVHLVDQSAEEIRTISYLLHPPLLDEAGLAPAIRWYAEGFMKRTGVAVDVKLAPDLGRLPQATEMALFRVVQECLTNVHRHAGPSSVDIEIVRTPFEVSLRVKDTGVGTARERREATVGFGTGILGMRERMRQLGGRLDIETGDSGTTVAATLPLGSSAPIGEDP